MIRVGPSSLLSSNLNEFHLTAPQTSGFYTNATSSVTPGIDYPQRIGLNVPIPPYPTNFKDKTFCVYRRLAGDFPPFTVSDVYLEIKRVSGGFQVARFTGYDTVLMYESPGDFSYGHGLLTDDITYLRLSSLLPVPTTFTWLSSASGTNPRLIIAYQSVIKRNTDGSFETSQVGGSIIVSKLTYNSTDIITYSNQGPSFLVTSLPLSPWGGSGLGGGTFEIWIITEVGVL